MDAKLHVRAVCTIDLEVSDRDAMMHGETINTKDIDLGYEQSITRVIESDLRFHNAEKHRVNTLVSLSEDNPYSASVQVALDIVFAYDHPSYADVAQSELEHHEQHKVSNIFSLLSQEGLLSQWDDLQVCEWNVDVSSSRVGFHELDSDSDANEDALALAGLRANHLTL